MRECLSPETKSHRLELVNNTINEQLTDQSISSEVIDENLIVLTGPNGVVELAQTGEQENGNKQIDKENDKEDAKVIESSLTETENGRIQHELNQLDHLTAESRPNDTNDDTIDELVSKRYPTFIQQSEYLDIPLNEQTNLHQKAIDEASAKRLARRLYNLDKFRKIDVCRHLSKNNEFNKAVASEYCNFFDFIEISLIDALRMFLSKFCLVGETQEREREILLHFAKRFHACNPTMFSSTDTVYTLACSIMILNQDLHSDVIIFFNLFFD